MPVYISVRPAILVCPFYREQQKAFYQETFARVRPVLTGDQYIRFVAYMDSFLEAIPEEGLLVME